MSHATQKHRLSLVNELSQYGQQAFNPSIQEGIRQPFLEKFELLVKNTSTLSLLSALSLIIQSSHITGWLRRQLVSTLARLPLRPGGVKDIIDFILSVHPSNDNISSSRENRGFCVTHEALNTISQLLTLPPSDFSAEEWFSGIAPQLLHLLLCEDGLEIDKVVAFVVGFGILGKRKFGSTGSPGWICLVEPIYSHLSPSDAVLRTVQQNHTSPDGIEYVRLQKIISTPIDVANSLKILTKLLTSHPHPALAYRILRPIIYSLWTLFTWPNGTDLTERVYRKPAKRLLSILLKLSSPKKQDTFSSSILGTVLEEYICRRHNFKSEKNWKFTMTKDGSIQIEENLHVNHSVDNIDLSILDNYIDHFIILLQENDNLHSEASILFTRLISTWLTQDLELDHASKIPTLVTSITQSESERLRLIESRVIQKMMTVFPEGLISNSKQLLEIIDQVLKDSNKDGKSKTKDKESLSIALSLLNVTLTTTSFRVTTENNSLMNAIEKNLGIIIKSDIPEISRTAGNLLMLLRLRDTVNPLESNPFSQTSLQINQHLEERKSYNLALSYLMGIDSPPPVRVQGLEILSVLLGDESPVIDIQALILLLSSLLVDNEEYVHLRVIKLLVQVSQKHPNTVIRDMINRYVDSCEECELDQRLRFGEVLLQAIQSNASYFKHESANFTCEGLLFVGGRRGYRPKTEARQETSKACKKKQILEAEEAWDGPVPNLDEVLGHTESGVHDAILQIVSGWESCRGMEDVRIRSSAVTILGAAIKANIQGIKTEILSTAMDLSIQILIIEKDAEKAILRRAAVMLIFNFIQALDSARTECRNLKFQLANFGLIEIQRVLEYTASTDIDDLVRQHSRDVIECLETFSVNSLLSLSREYHLRSSPDLVGLPVMYNCQDQPDNVCKIEEVE